MTSHGLKKRRLRIYFRKKKAPGKNEEEEQASEKNLTAPGPTGPWGGEGKDPRRGTTKEKTGGCTLHLDCRKSAGL